MTVGDGIIRSGEPLATASAQPVFISHASADAQQAKELCRFIEAEGVRCWIAPRDIPPGDSWPSAINAGVKASRVLVVVITQRAMSAEHVLREVELAVASRVTVMPIRLDNAPLSGGLEYLLSSVQWVEAIGDPPEQCARKVCEALKSPVVNRLRDARGKPLAAPWLAAGVGLAMLVVAVGILLRQGSMIARAPPPEPVPLSPDTAGLAVAELLKTVWTTEPPAMGPSRPALALDILAAVDGADALVAIDDGAVLRSAVDLYVLVAQPSTPGHLYIFQIDTKGQVFWLFPRNDTCEFSSGTNPVTPGRIVIPGNGLGLWLDDVPGREYVCAVFANSRWMELERRIAGSVAATKPFRPLPGDLIASRTRGVAGARRLPQGQGTMRVGDRDLAAPVLGSLLHEASGSLIVIGRSFIHE